MPKSGAVKGGAARRKLNSQPRKIKSIGVKDQRGGVKRTTSSMATPTDYTAVGRVSLGKKKKNSSWSGKNEERGGDKR